MLLSCLVRHQQELMTGSTARPPKHIMEYLSPKHVVWWTTFCKVHSCCVNIMLY
jgi:hypothetical protein